MSVNFASIRKRLAAFEFQKLFIEELGWSNPTSRSTTSAEVNGRSFSRRQIAQLAGVVVFEVASQDGTIPDAKTRLALHREIAKLHHEHLLVFVNHERTQSLWYWVKREDGKLRPRDHYFFQGQPGDLFISKLGAIVFELGELDQTGSPSVIEVASRLRSALDVERVTKQFYRDYEDQHLAFLELIEGVKDDHDRRWYASVLLNRLMFIYFLQRKGFLDGGKLDYLQIKLTEGRKAGRNRFFQGFLRTLFFEGFAKPEDKRSAEARKLLGNIRYLNGGLFLPHRVEQECPKLNVPDRAFENLLALFERYSWNLNDTPGGEDREINPDVLGYIFEKYINQKAFGAYYTRTEITEYLCEQTIHRLILDAVNTPGIAGMTPARDFSSVADLLLNLDASLCRRLLLDILPGLSLLDPACGSGAFLVAAMKTLIAVYSAVIGKIKFVADTTLSDWLKKREREHRSLAYFIKKTIITDNLYGVDIMEEAAEIAKLRLFLALVAAAETVDQLEPLPNIDFNILAGNSLIGLMRVDDQQFEKRMEGQLFRQRSYRQTVEEKNRLIETFRHTATYADDLTSLRDAIEEKKRAAREVLNDLLLAEFEHLGIKYEQATWDDKKGQEGRPTKRGVKIDDIEALCPFHWGYEFDEILNRRGGFDAIITNPPWEIFKPNSKEFFEDHSDLVTKKNMTIHEFEKEQAKLLKDKDVREAWLRYLSSYPYVSAYFRNAPQYRNQISIVKGKKAGTDINLYKLFVEQSFNLLRSGGACGIITPASIYNDLGSKQLRELLLGSCEVTALFGLSNERFIFEGVHHAQKFCLLSFRKGNSTVHFPAAFRINPRVAIDCDHLERFLHASEEHVRIDASMIRRLSPDSLSVMEFKNETDVVIAEKMLRFPLLGEDVKGRWKVSFSAEFHMTNDSHLFKDSPGRGRRPLYEGKMIWHFDHRFAEPRYWVDEKEARAAVLGRTPDEGQMLDYQAYRLGFRDIASNTNERTMVSSLIPPTFHGNKLPTVRIFEESGERAIGDDHQLFLCAIWNSYVVDYLIRMKVTTTLNFFYVYQLPVPRLISKDKAFRPIVERATRLICTTQEFDDLAREVGLKGHKQGVTDPAERAKLRAELDGLITHLYGLTEEEFAYVLTTFPLVPDPVKIAAQNAYRDVARGVIK
ncbi:MAG TPA: DNA methyltransferase [Phycisphaerae bacterium]|nr:DNA methyltransferase [Phycisphaerae bacterium]